MSPRGREGEPMGGERGEPSVLDKTIHALHVHIENWGRHADEGAKRDSGLNVEEAAFVRALVEAEIPEDRKEAVLGVINAMLALAEETKEGDEGAMTNLRELKEKLQG